MRKNKAFKTGNNISMIALDDDKIMTLTLQSYFQSSGYDIDIENDPIAAIERIKNGRYDILLLDFLMTPICGNEVVSRIREFNSDIYIILLTGHKSMAPPIKTIRELDIQGYYEKSDRFDQLELLIESCAKSIKQMRTIKGYRDGLNNIIDETSKLFRPQPVNELFVEILCSIQKMFSAGCGFIYLCSGDEDFYFGNGNYSDTKESATDKLCNAKKIFINSDGNYVRDEKGIIVPIFSTKRYLTGIIYVEDNSYINGENMQLFEIYMRQVISVINNISLYSALNKNYIEMITALRSMVDAKDIYTRGHSDRVSHFAELIAGKMGFSQEAVDIIRLGGLFHDIGKIGISDSVLLKPGSLTDEEYALIKKHTTNGYMMLSGIKFFEKILPMTLYHHERIDGGGYPEGISGENIPIEARIVSVADAFDAMTSHRRYRDNLNIDQAKQQLILGRGTQFDASIVDVFLEILESYDAIKDEFDLKNIENSINFR